MRQLHQAVLSGSFLLLFAACSVEGSGGSGDDPGLVGLELSAVKPGLVVPGSRLIIEGSSFVGEAWGASRLRLTGTFAGGAADVALPAQFADFNRMEIVVDQAFFSAFGGGDGD